MWWRGEGGGGEGEGRSCISEYRVMQAGEEDHRHKRMWPRHVRLVLKLMLQLDYFHCNMLTYM